MSASQIEQQLDEPTAIEDQLQERAKTAVVSLPNFHPAQRKALAIMARARFVALRCGRRWGKNVFGESIAVDFASHGQPVGWFAPENKRLAESYDVMLEALEPIKKSSDKTKGVIKTITGGKVECWSLEDPNAGRSRKYKIAIGDEIAFTKPKSIDIWTKAIRPTLVDLRGRALMMSNTAGIDPDNMFYALCHDPSHGFVQFWAPSRTNPHLPADEVAAFKRDNPPLVYEQEYEAKFVDWSGNAFFVWDRFLVNNAPVEMPARCEAVFAIIDSAVKTGKKNDGTGVVYFALIRAPLQAVGPGGKVGPKWRLVILDWDLKQIEGALLETWLPTVFQQLEAYARQCKATQGSMGAFIEDKASGTILIQQASRRGWPARAIDSKLTAMGKDERAISVSGYVYRGLVKVTKLAAEKVVNYKGTTRNHLQGQLTGFRIGDKDATREDDILDCFSYGTAITFGDSEGF